MSKEKFKLTKDSKFTIMVPTLMPTKPKNKVKGGWLFPPLFTSSELPGKALALFLDYFHRPGQSRKPLR